MKTIFKYFVWEKIERELFSSVKDGKCYLRYDVELDGDTLNGVIETNMSFTEWSSIAIYIYKSECSHYDYILEWNMSTITNKQPATVNWVV